MTTIPSIYSLNDYEGFFDDENEYHVLLDWTLDWWDPNYDYHSLVILIYWTHGEGLSACAFDIDSCGNLIDCELTFV